MAKAKKETLSLEGILEQAIVKEEDRPYEVPGNWVWTRFSNVCTFDNGYAFKSDDYKDNGIPLVRISNIIDNEIDLSNCVYIDNENIPEKFIIKQGDLLIAMSGATTGKNGVYLLDKPAYLNQRVGNIKLKDENLITHKFRDFYVMDKNVEILRKAYGGAQPNISGSLIGEFLFPLPPLPEQQRIEEVIESLFEKLDAAKELVQNALDSFESRKAAVLHKAFTGELTARWREENAAGQWKKCILNDVILEKPRNGYSPNGVSYVTKYKNLTLSATTTGVFKGECFKYVDIDISDDSYLWLKSGDILIQRSNSLEYVGTCAIYDGKDNEYIYPDLMMKIKANDTYIIPRFLHYILSDIDTKKYYRNNATGTAGNMPKINQKTVMNTPIVLPSLAEQQEIVRILDNLLENEKSAKELSDVIEKIELMKKAILARAFRGELGTNNPEEESAVELLKKVLKEKK